MVHGRHLTHFDHTNCIKSNNRPFNDIEEMNSVLINNINSVVKEKDTLYHLGDFSWRKNRVQYFRSQIRCKNIVLIMGNHDYKCSKTFLKSIFNRVEDLLSIVINNQTIVLCHYAMRVWNKSHYGSYMLFGHSHGMLSENISPLSLDVGVDCWDYAPINYNRIESVMLNKQNNLSL